MVGLHEFMVAVSGIEVHRGGSGGTAPDAVVWDNGRILKLPSSSNNVIVDHASLPGPLGFLGKLMV